PRPGGPGTRTDVGSTAVEIGDMESLMARTLHDTPSGCRGRSAAHRRGPVKALYCSNARTDCGAALACDRMAVPACCRICARVSAAVSAAKSASWMRLRAAERFSTADCRFAIVDSNRFWIAPNWLRRLLTDRSAESTRVIVSLALATVVT